jgi:hypothetical protein
MNIEINNRVVTKNGEEIGMIQDGTCHLLAKVGPTVKGAIKKASGIETLAFVVGEAEDEENDAPTPSLADMSDDDLAAEMKRRGLIQEAPAVVESPAIVQPAVVERDLSAVERLHKLADDGKIPKPPAKHPAMGDKTPEYVAWFKSRATPEEIAKRYPDNRRVPASVAEFAKAQAKIYDKLPGEKKDTGKENDFTDKAE